MLSRSLGPATGGAVGILFYLATTLSGAMYIIGAIEILRVSSGFTLGPEALHMRLFSVIALVLIMVINWFGINWVSKLGVLFLSLVILSLGCILVGMVRAKMSWEFFVDNWDSSYVSPEDNFFTMVAVFFPACTGIMTGANRSGDLKNPSKSIPKGTLLAQLTTTLIYYAFSFLFVLCGSRQDLQNLASIFVAEMAWPTKWLVIVGIIVSSLGAALQCLAGSPRLFQAIANDDLMPFLKRFSKSKLFTLSFNSTICLLAIMIGSVDAVAPIVSIFYLVCYTTVNFACFLLDYLGSPNWRPTWRFYGKLTSLAGVLVCFSLMIMISWYYAITSIVIALCLYGYIDKRTKERDWGDGMEGMRAERARDALLKLDKYKTNVKNWRPKYLVLGSVDEKGEISSLGSLTLLKQL
jgi:solute carrier family 12 (potassium/chloride transporter), member 4/6